MSPNDPRLGQGLSFIGNYDPNSSSFYSNNTSTISNTLNNSRYTIMNGNPG